MSSFKIGVPCSRLSLLLFSCVFFWIMLSFPPLAVCQEKFPDKIYPRSETWSIKCIIYRMTDKNVLVLFPGQEKPAEILRTSLSRLEFADGRQIVFNKDGQVEGEILLPKPATVAKVLNPGLLKLNDGEEIILNGIDFFIPADSLGQHFFQMATEYLRSMIEGKQVTIQFDLQRRDEFGRYRAYVLLTDGTMINALLLKLGYCKLDRKRPLFYMKDFEALEKEAQRNKRGIWGINNNAASK